MENTKMNRQFKNDKVIAEFQNQSGYIPMEKIYIDHAIQDRLILITKKHTLKIIKVLEKIGLVYSLDDTSSEYLDSIYILSGSVSDNK